MCGRLLSLVRLRVTAFVAMLSVANDTRTGRANPASMEASGKEFRLCLSLTNISRENVHNVHRHLSIRSTDILFKKFL